MTIGCVSFGAGDVFKDHGGGKDGVIVGSLDLSLVRSMGGKLGHKVGTETDDKPHALLHRISVHKWMVVRYLIIVAFGWGDMTLESSTKAAMDILIDRATDSVFRKEFQSKHLRMFNCHSLIDELVPDEEVPSHIDRWSNEIPLELRKSGK